MFHALPACRTDLQPLPIHSSMAWRDQRTREPNLTGAGIRPAWLSRYTWRGEQSSSWATACTSRRADVAESGGNVTVGTGLILRNCGSAGVTAAHCGSPVAPTEVHRPDQTGPR